MFNNIIKLNKTHLNNAFNLLTKLNSLNRCNNTIKILSYNLESINKTFATSSITPVIFKDAVKLKKKNINKNDKIDQQDQEVQLEQQQEPDHTEIVANHDRKRKILHLEMSVLRQEGAIAPDPDLLTEDQWERLLALETRSARRKYYTFLFKTEKTKENQQYRKERRRVETQERLEQLRESNRTNDHIIYGLSHTTFHLRIYDATINLWNNNKLCRAMVFGQKLIMDCSYDEYMNERESINAAKQLMLCFAENRSNDDPFDIHFCNANAKGTTMHYLHKHIPTMYDDWFPMNVHAASYLELFPKEQLVYLTPHCRNELEEYNHDDIYIIGAMVDKMNNEPLSLAKAKKLGLRMARLPLERNLFWGSGSNKSLTLNQMVKILLDKKMGNTWKNTLEQNVPKRKLIDRSEIEMSNNTQWNRQSMDQWKYDFKNNKRQQQSNHQRRAATVYKDPKLIENIFK